MVPSAQAWTFQVTDRSWYTANQRTPTVNKHSYKYRTLRRFEMRNSYVGKHRLNNWWAHSCCQSVCFPALVSGIQRLRGAMETRCRQEWCNDITHAFNVINLFGKLTERLYRQGTLNPPATPRHLHGEEWRILLSQHCLLTQLREIHGEKEFPN